MMEGEFRMAYDRVVQELTAKYGKPVEFRRSAYSPLLQSVMRRHAIWDDSIVQVLLLADRDSKFAPLLDLVVARASAQLGGGATSEDPPSSKTGLMLWLMSVTPAIQPSYLMHPNSGLDPDLTSQFDPVDTMPLILVQQTPVYPAEAMYKGKEGTVWIKALVDEDGLVRAVRLAKPSETGFDFESTCINAAFGNTFKPATRRGVPVPIWVTYPVEFRLK
jgi:TonB family protein